MKKTIVNCETGNIKEVDMSDDEIALKQKLEKEHRPDYKKNRLDSFPSIGDQLDYIFWNGLEKWKTDIVQPIKDKYPKPS